MIAKIARLVSGLPVLLRVTIRNADGSASTPPCRVLRQPADMLAAIAPPAHRNRRLEHLGEFLGRDAVLVLACLVVQIERRVRDGFPPRVVLRRWHLNTCLVNFYGDRLEADRTVDAARVGDHRDFEPGPVGSLSLGERARFQFVRRGARDAPPARTQWLDDGSLQVFGGPRWKDELLHRVQRVDDKHNLDLPPAIPGFRTRRVNFTFRYVPDEHVVPFADLPPAARDDVRDYVATLAASSAFFAAALAAERTERPAAAPPPPPP